MSTQRVTACSNKELLWALFVLTGFFLVIEVGCLIQQFHDVLADLTFTDIGFHMPTPTLISIGVFITIQLTLHILYTLCIWCVVLGLMRTSSYLKSHNLYVCIGIWFITTLTLVLANQVIYPNSRLASTVVGALPDEFILYVFYIFASLCISILALAAYPVIKRAYHQPMISVPLLILLSANIYLFYGKSKPEAVHDASTTTRPNIIIIGMDSLRPDFISYFSNERNTPFIDSFLQQATVFSDAVTPLARTYPAWVSILSGDYPKTTGARTNLSNYSDIHIKQSLPNILNKVGYQSIYATDESRFNNIDEAYGFDKAIVPPIGVTNFLIGSINDFPLSNLLMTTRVGKWLFPNTYANRPSYFTYNPDTFLELVNENIPSHRQKPLFLTVHFCLAHFPYTWGALNRKNTRPREWYLASVERVDTQINDFFQRLEQKKLLNHAIVILLSDHGEAFEISGDRITEKDLYVGKRKVTDAAPHFYPKSRYFIEETNQSAGHGSDVLSLTQQHSLLAFKLYGVGFQQIGVIPGVVALIDIKPTIMDIINIKQRLQVALARTDGKSLIKNIKGEAQHVPKRHIFLETGYSPESLRTTYPDINTVMIEGINTFDIDPVTTRVTFKPSIKAMIMQSKQYADIYNNWILAFYPQENNKMTAILVNLITGQWTDNLESSFARQSPAKEMKQQLQTFYSDELHLA